MKYIDIENTDKSVADLVQELEDHNKRIDQAVIYMLTGLICSKILSEQEYKVFIERVLSKSKFDRIAMELSLSQSSVKTYYSRALKKLNKIAIETECKFNRKNK